MALAAVLVALALLAVGGAGSFVINHPADVLKLTGDIAGFGAGALLALLGAGEEGGGLVADATGVGVPVGVPLNVAGAAGIAEISWAGVSAATPGSRSRAARTCGDTAGLGRVDAEGFLGQDGPAGHN